MKHDLASLAFALAVTLTGCGPGYDNKTEAVLDADLLDTDPTADAAPTDLDAAAEAYVKLVLAVGQHDADYVDAYYGDETWQTEATAQALPLDQIRGRAVDLVESLGAGPPEGEEIVELRWRYLERQLAALITRVDMLISGIDKQGGATLSFDEEAQRLYDVVPPSHGEEHFQATLGELDGLLAAEGFGAGSLIERYEAFRKDFRIPPEKLDAVFRQAIDDCRQRTRVHIELPPGESFQLSYVTDKPWSGYNWYQGGFQSLIQVNTDLPIYVDRAIDLACHEGYPGHHLYNALLEKHLVEDRGWVEYSVYPLFSPQSLIAEGTANFGIEMAFPGEERLAYERDVLYPLAGLDPARAQIYQRVQGLVDRLDYAGNEAARRYLDGEIDAAAAADWLTRFAAMDPERAAQRVKFIDKYRSYVINYNLGLDLVRRYVEAQAGDDQARRWQVFEQLLSSPRLPSGLPAQEPEPPVRVLGPTPPS